MLYKNSLGFERNDKRNDRFWHKYINKNTIELKKKKLRWEIEII